MGMTTQWRATMVAVFMLLAYASSGAHGQAIPLVTGEQWTRSHADVKKAYLVGIANTLHVEAAFEGTNPPADAQSIMPRLIKGMSGHSLDSVRDGLDRWYAANPSRLQRPVIEVIWFEWVVPGLKKGM